MFCFQCQETSEGRGCTFGGHCGKSEETANYQDLLIFVLKGIGVVADRLAAAGGVPSQDLGDFVYESLFMTVTNTNFDTARFVERIERALEWKRGLLAELHVKGLDRELPEPATWDEEPARYAGKACRTGVLQTEDPDVRSLRETITYSLKGICACAHHAAYLGAYDPQVAAFVLRALATVVVGTDLDLLFELELETRKYNLIAMGRLDAVHAKTFGMAGK
jgi:hydroxylamine reductase